MIKTSLRSFGQFSKSSFTFKDSLLSVFKEHEIRALVVSLNSFAIIFPATSLWTFGFCSEALDLTVNSAFIYILNSFFISYKVKNVVSQIKISEDGKRIFISRISSSNIFREYDIKDVEPDDISEAAKSDYLSLYRFKAQQTLYTIPKSGEIINIALLESIIKGEEVEWLDE